MTDFSTKVRRDHFSEGNDNPEGHFGTLEYWPGSLAWFEPWRMINLNAITWTYDSIFKVARSWTAHARSAGTTSPCSFHDSKNHVPTYFAWQELCQGRSSSSFLLWGYLVLYRTERRWELQYRRVQVAISRLSCWGGGRRYPSKGERKGVGMQPCTSTLSKLGRKYSHYWTHARKGKSRGEVNVIAG